MAKPARFLPEMAFVFEMQVRFCLNGGCGDRDPEDPNLMRVEQVLRMHKRHQALLYEWKQKGTAEAAQYWRAIYGQDWTPLLQWYETYLVETIHLHWFMIIDDCDPDGTHAKARDLMLEQLAEFRQVKAEFIVDETIDEQQAFFDACRRVAPLLTAAD